MIKSLGKGNKSTNENITCLYCTFVKHLSTIDQKTSQAAKNQKNFMKYLGRVQNYFSDENICEEKLKVKIQHHCQTRFFYTLIKYSIKVSFEVKKSAIFMMKRAVQFKDSDNNSIIIMNFINQEFIEEMIRIGFNHQKERDGIHFNSRLLKIIFKEKIVYKKYLSIDLLSDLLSLSENKHCDLSSETMIIFEKIMFSDNQACSHILEKLLSENSKKTIDELFLKRVNSDNYMFKREILTVWISLFGEYTYNSVFIKDFCNNLEIIKNLLVSLNTKNIFLVLKILCLLSNILQYYNLLTDGAVKKLIKKNILILKSVASQFKDSLDIEEFNAKDQSQINKVDELIAILQDIGNSK